MFLTSQLQLFCNLSCFQEGTTSEFLHSVVVIIAPDDCNAPYFHFNRKKLLACTYQNFTGVKSDALRYYLITVTVTDVINPC